MSKLFQIKVKTSDENEVVALDSFISAETIEDAKKVFDAYIESVHFTTVIEALESAGVSFMEQFKNAELIECPGVTVVDRDECVIFSMADPGTDWTLKERTID